MICEDLTRKMMESQFNNDLSREVLLGKYLDGIYPSILQDFQIQRVSDIEQQHKGIDIIVSKGNMVFHVDEKAQLDYLESDLPTFAFEISYIKDGTQRQGWLFDQHKTTDRYFTITGISCNTPGNPKSGFKNCKITSVDRAKLIRLLSSKGLTYERIAQINQDLRAGAQSGKISIAELNSNMEGNFHYTITKAEKPINIVLKLQFLIDSGVAKRIH